FESSASRMISSGFSATAWLSICTCAAGSRLPTTVTSAPSPLSFSSTILLKTAAHGLPSATLTTVTFLPSSELDPLSSEPDSELASSVVAELSAGSAASADVLEELEELDEPPQAATPRASASNSSTPTSSFGPVAGRRPPSPPGGFLARNIEFSSWFRNPTDGTHRRLIDRILTPVRGPV